MRLFKCQKWKFQLILHHKNEKKILTFWPPTPKKYFEKFFSSKISIWVLKRIVLTSWKRFLLYKSHQRSFRTRIRHVIELYILLINNVPYSGTERSLMNFLYQKTFSSRQEDSFKYPYRYFWRKKNSKFFLGWGGQKVKNLFPILWCKNYWNFHFWHSNSRKMLNSGCFD